MNAYGQTRTSERSAFPLFADGDVMIIITSARRFRLHATMLSHSSETLGRMLTTEAAAKLSKAAKKKGVVTRYRLILVEKASHVDAREMDYILKPQIVDENGFTGDQTPVLHEVHHSGGPAPAFAQAWERVFGAFYGRAIDIGHHDDAGMVGILEAATEVLKVAEYLDCVSIITKPIEAALLAAGQLLPRSISAAPASWLDFSSRVRSRAVFREALIHAAGCYKTPEIQSAIANHSIDEGVIDVLRAKGNALFEGSRRVQSSILSYYPPALTRQRGLARADRESIGRASYGNDILWWIALVIVRQWCSQMLNNDKTHNAEDMGFAFFSLIGGSGEAYLDRPALGMFHHHFPMSAKGQAVVENHVAKLKEDIKGFPKDLLKNHAFLDIKRYPVKYFTSTVVTQEDYPWEKKQTPVPEPESDANSFASLSPRLSGRKQIGFDEEREMDIEPEDEEAAFI